MPHNLVRLPGTSNANAQKAEAILASGLLLSLRSATAPQARVITAIDGSE